MPINDKVTRSGALIGPWGIPFPGLTGTMFRASNLDYFLNQNTTGSPVEPPGLEPRFYPIDWLPRWMNPYYSESSIFQKLYFHGLYLPKQEILDDIQYFGFPKFYGPISEDSYLFNLTLPANFNPDSALSITDLNNKTLRYSDQDSFFYVKDEPVWTLNNGSIIVRNLEQHSVSVVSSDGFVDLSSNFTSNPPTPDSNFIFVNSYGDQFYFDGGDNRRTESLFYLGINGTYRVLYKSQSKLNNLSYLYVNGFKTVPTKITNRNKWDLWSSFYGYRRNGFESNVSLQTKSQHLSFLTNPEMKISAILGRTEAFRWHFDTPLNLSGSGFVNYRVENLVPVRYIDEYLHKENSNFIFTFPPTNLLEVTYNNLPIPSTDYIVDGSTLTFINPYLNDSQSGTVFVRYKTTVINVERDDSFIIELSRPDNTSLIVIASKDVKINQQNKKLKEWRWDREYGLQTGLANFI